MARGEDIAPSDWPWKTLEALASPEGMVCDGDWVESKDQDPNGEVRLIQLADIGDGFFRDRSDRFLTLKRARELNCTFLRPGDLLIARMPDPLGRACIFPDIGQPAVTVVDVCIWRPGDSDFDVRWLMHFINSPSMRATIQAQATGTTRQRISGARLKATKVRVPPPLLRSRISQRIDELFGEIEAGEQELGAGKTDLGRYRRAVLRAAVTGELTRDWREQNPPNETGADLLARILKERRARWEEAEHAKFSAKGKTPNAWKARYPEPVAPNTDGLPELPEGWVWSSLDQLTFKMTSGSRAWSKYYDRGSSIFIMAQNVRPARFDLTFKQFVDPPQNDPERERTRVAKDDVLVTIVGANTGDVCRLTERLDDAYVCQSVALLRPVDPDWSGYIEAFLVAEEGGQAQFAKQIYGAGRPHLSFDQLRNVAIPIPPSGERAEIVTVVREAIDTVAEFASQIEAQARDVARLRESILAAAFTGKLIEEASGAPTKGKRRHVA